MVAPCHCHTIFERTGRERERGSCNKLRLARGRRNICQRGERASHKGELIKRLNFQEWPFVRVRKAIEISVLSRLTSSIPPPRSIFHRQQTEGGGDERRTGRANRTGFSCSTIQRNCCSPLSSHLARGSRDDAKSVEADFEFFSEKMGEEATDRSSGHPASATRRRCTQYLKGTHN